MTQFRLLPVVLIGVIGLLGIKVVHLVANGDWISGSTVPALAQEAPNAADSQQAAPRDTPAAEGTTPEQTDAEEGPPSLIEGMRVDPTGYSRSELAILERLAKRREQLDEKEKSLGMREALLKAAEKRLQQRIDELKALEASIEEATQKRKKEQEEDLGKLVAMYQAMKPKQAAKIFEVLDTNTLLEIVKIMNPRKVAAIMGEMKADSAGVLSLAIANGKSLEEEVKDMGVDSLPQIGN